jgi:UDP:flavonoid glycosyltransferase YjiC (YdhE family)
MKVLVVCIPLAGHPNPLKPLIGAFVDAGDEVLVASGPDLRREVAAAGAESAPDRRGRP